MMAHDTCLGLHARSNSDEDSGRMASSPGLSAASISNKAVLSQPNTRSANSCGVSIEYEVVWQTTYSENGSSVKGRGSYAYNPVHVHSTVLSICPQCDSAM